MALAVLILIGAFLGWTASIVARTESGAQILRQIALGLAASLVVGIIVNGGTILGGLSLYGLGAAIAAAILALAIYHVVLRRAD